MLALASACFALTYFAASRWVSHPPNNSLGLLHFAMATIGFVLLLLSLLCSSGDASAQSIAEVAIGRRLAVRLYWMWGNGCENSASVGFGWYAGQLESGNGVK
jgi:hypothetical protein